MYTEELEPKEILHIDWYTLFGAHSIDFTHISGENFVIYIRNSEDARKASDYEPGRDGISKAEFRLYESGKVKEMGLLLEAEMGGEKIWFTKIE